MARSLKGTVPSLTYIAKRNRNAGRCQKRVHRIISRRNARCLCGADLFRDCPRRTSGECEKYNLANHIGGIGKKLVQQIACGKPISISATLSQLDLAHFFNLVSRPFDREYSMCL
jgi:hypothetical protein